MGKKRYHVWVQVMLTLVRRIGSLAPSWVAVRPVWEFAFPRELLMRAWRVSFGRVSFDFMVISWKVPSGTNHFYEMPLLIAKDILKRAKSQLEPLAPPLGPFTETAWARRT